MTPDKMRSVGTHKYKVSYADETSEDAWHIAAELCVMRQQNEMLC
jgi:hypothetical protein